MQWAQISHQDVTSGTDPQEALEMKGPICQDHVFWLLTTLGSLLHLSEKRVYMDSVYLPERLKLQQLSLLHAEN